MSPPPSTKSPLDGESDPSEQQNGNFPKENSKGTFPDGTQHLPEKKLQLNHLIHISGADIEFKKLHPDDPEVRREITAGLEEITQS